MKEKARHILCLAFLKSGEKNMEKILIYQVKEKEAVKQLLAPMKIRLEEIKTTDLRQSIGDLAEGKKNVLTAPFTGSAPQESLMVFCGVMKSILTKYCLNCAGNRFRLTIKQSSHHRTGNGVCLCLCWNLRRRKTASGRETETKQGQIRNANGQAGRFLYEM